MPEVPNLIAVTIADADGYQARTDAYITLDPDTTSVSALLGVVAGFLTKVQNCCGGRIVDAQVRLGVDVSSFAAKTIETGAVVEQSLALRFSNSGDANPWNYLVPAVSSGVIVLGAPDMSEDATIDVLTDSMENTAPPIAGFAYATNRGGSLVPTASGFLSTRKRSIQSRRLSIRVGT